MRWTKNDTQLLKEEYLKKGEYVLSKIINKSPNAIRIKAFRLKISKLSYRKKIKLLPEEKQVILGGLLGDLYCRIKKTCKNAQIEGAHCKKQEPYLLWKLDVLKNLSFNLRRTKTGYLFFESKTYPCLNYYHKLFYKNGKKEINNQILKEVGKLGLAIWYMDDGSYKKRDKLCKLHTNGFSYKENLILKNWFEEKWGISTKIYTHKDLKRYPDKEWYYLSFNSKGSKKLLGIIENYIHPCMKYKLGVN